ncbi:hypothetical protein [Aquipuribacter nitratireducens]|uniref:Uncharacterized protein n=1 Tax=Aquipuribacter nitratireducens TaxID=650104 RepID=A0ABW0GI05_9MICO
MRHARLLPVVATAACAAIVTTGLAVPASADRVPAADFTSEVVVYDADTGRQVTIDLRTATTTGTLADRRWSAGWDHVVPVDYTQYAAGNPATLVYNSTTGRYAVVDHYDDGSTVTLAQGQWSRGWDVITTIPANSQEPGRVDEVMLVDSETGRVVVLETFGLDGGAGFRTVADQSSTAPVGTDTVLASEAFFRAPGDDVFREAALVFYDSRTGERSLGFVSSSYANTLVSVVVEDTLPAWSAGWDVVSRVEVDGTAGDEVLFYNARTGRSILADLLDATYRYRVISQRPWSAGWDVTVVEADGSLGSEVLLYNPETGRQVTVDLKRDGSTGTYADRQWSRGWDSLVAIETEFFAD